MMSSRGRQIAIFLLKLALGIAIVFWLVATGRFDLSMYRELGSVTALGYVFALLLTQAASTLIVMSRWWLLVDAQGIPMSYRESLLLSCRGSFMGLFLPGTLGLDGLRIFHIQQNYRSQLAAGIASVTLDRALGFVGLLMLAIGFSSGYLLARGEGISPSAVVGMFALLLACTLLLALVCGYAPPRLSQQLGKIRFLEGFLTALAEYRHNRGAVVLVILMSVLGSFLFSVAAGFGLKALGIEFSFVALAAVTPLIIVVRFLPLTPLGLGVSDAAAVELYQAVNLVGGAENQMLMRATWILVILACGLAFMISPTSLRRRAAVSRAP